MSYIVKEKEKAARVKKEAEDKLRITGCLDPLTKTLISFDDDKDLTVKIHEIFHRLDFDDSGGVCVCVCEREREREREREGERGRERERALLGVLKNAFCYANAFC